MSLFIGNLFEELNKNNIKYAILRNYSAFPKQDPTSNYYDLDLLVFEKDFIKYEKLLQKIAKKWNWIIVKEINREYVRTRRIYSVDQSERLSGIQIDTHVLGQNWWGFFYLDEKQILKERKLYGNIYVVSEFHQHLFNWLDKLLWGNYVKEKYYFNIIKTLRKEEDRLRVFLYKRFGKNLSLTLNRLIQDNKLEETLKFRNMMIFKIILYSTKNYPLLTIKTNIKYFYNELIIRFLVPGLCFIFEENIKIDYESLHNKLGLVFMDKKKIIFYNGNSLLEWIDFYFRKVYPITRKGGLVFIITPFIKHIFIKNKLNSIQFENKINKSMQIYKQKSFAGVADLLVEIPK